MSFRKSFSKANKFPKCFKYKLHIQETPHGTHYIVCSVCQLVLAKKINLNRLRRLNRIIINDQECYLAFDVELLLEREMISHEQEVKNNFLKKLKTKQQ